MRNLTPDSHTTTNYHIRTSNATVPQYQRPKPMDVPKRKAGNRGVKGCGNACRIRVNLAFYLLYAAQL